MKEHIGTRVKILADGVVYHGDVVGDRHDRVLVRVADGKVHRVIKSHITSFVPDVETEPLEPIQLLFCKNQKIKCPGVQFISAAEVATAKEYEKFMGPCPFRNPDCVCATKGDIRSCPGEYLKSVLAGVLFGDYPKKGKKANGSDTKPQ